MAILFLLHCVAKNEYSSLSELQGACILINENKVNHADTYACNMETTMANVKQGNLNKSPQWWKHLKDWKRVFWKSERQAQKKDIKSVDNN